MNRRQFCQKSSTVLGTLPLVSSLLALAPAISLEATTQSTSALNRGTGSCSPPVLQNPSGDGGITVVWSVDGPSTGRVEYGETEQLGQMADGGDEGLRPYDDKVIKVRLTGLKPGTTYFYRAVTTPVDFKDAYHIARGVDVPGEIYQFKTLDAKAAATTFSLINDTHQTQETMTRLVGMIQTQPTDSLIWNGDIFNSVDSEKLIAEEVLHPFGLTYAATLPLILVKGNHDVRGACSRLLDKYTDVPNGRWYYTLRQGPIAFLVLDTGEDKPDHVRDYAGLSDFSRYRDAQKKWLAGAIQQPEFRDAPFRVVLMHIPMLWRNYTAQEELTRYCAEAREKWHDLLVEAKIDLIISGHTHLYAWFAPGEQAPYAQLIGGGPKPETATLIRGEADSKTMKITMCDLDGKELRAHTFSRQA